MSKILKTRKFGLPRCLWPNFGIVDKIDEKNADFPLTYYYNCFRNEMKEFMSPEFTQDDLKDIRRVTRIFCDTQANLFQTPPYYFTRIVSGMLLAVDSEDADTKRAKMIDILCREYKKLMDNKLIKRNTKNPLWKIIYYMTHYDNNKLALFNIFGIMYFYEV